MQISSPKYHLSQRLITCLLLGMIFSPSFANAESVSIAIVPVAKGSSVRMTPIMMQRIVFPLAKNYSVIPFKDIRKEAKSQNISLSTLNGMDELVKIGEKLNFSYAVTTEIGSRSIAVSVYKLPTSAAIHTQKVDFKKKLNSTLGNQLVKSIIGVLTKAEQSKEAPKIAAASPAASSTTTETSEKPNGSPAPLVAIPLAGPTTTATSSPSATDAGSPVAKGETEPRNPETTVDMEIAPLADKAATTSAPPKDAQTEHADADTATQDSATAAETQPIDTDESATTSAPTKDAEIEHADATAATQETATATEIVAIDTDESAPPKGVYNLDARKRPNFSIALALTGRSRSATLCCKSDDGELRYSSGGLFFPGVGLSIDAFPFAQFGMTPWWTHLIGFHFGLKWSSVSNRGLFELRSDSSPYIADLAMNIRWVLFDRKNASDLNLRLGYRYYTFPANGNFGATIQAFPNIEYNLPFVSLRYNHPFDFSIPFFDSIAAYGQFMAAFGANPKLEVFLEEGLSGHFAYVVAGGIKLNMASLFVKVETEFEHYGAYGTYDPTKIPEGRQAVSFKSKVSLSDVSLGCTLFLGVDY